jgi:hypothetical protein
MRAAPSTIASASTLLGMALALGACSTEPNTRPFRAEYADGYEPPLVLSATEACDRTVTHVLLEIGDEGFFELSTNVQDDCTRGGGGFTGGEVYRTGTYARQGATLSFTSDGSPAPEFTGTLEPGRIVLVFAPGLDTLASAVEVPVTRKEVPL